MRKNIFLFLGMFWMLTASFAGDLVFFVRDSSDEAVKELVLNSPEIINKTADLVDDNHHIEATLLWAAVEFSRYDLAEFLLEQGADTEIGYIPSNSTPLLFAAGYSSAEMVELLLKYGANPNARNNTGRLPLFETVVHFRHPDDFDDAVRIVEMLTQCTTIEIDDFLTTESLITGGDPAVEKQKAELLSMIKAKYGL
jgi:ankyrin repeat protein